MDRAAKAYPKLNKLPISSVLRKGRAAESQRSMAMVHSSG